MFRFITTIIFALSALAAHAAVDVNKATQADLEALRGVGPSLSTKIIEARKAGEFRHWGDLVERVRGVGPASASRLSQAGLTVSGAAYDGPSSAPSARHGKRGSGSPAAKPLSGQKSPKSDKAGGEKAR